MSALIDGVSLRELTEARNLLEDQEHRNERDIQWARSPGDFARILEVIQTEIDRRYALGLDDDE